MHQRRLLRLVLLSILSLNLYLILNWWPAISQPPVAHAHAFVIGSDPIDGSTISTMPPVVRIFFNEDISPASIAHVIAADGEIVDARRSSVSNTNPRELDTPLRAPTLLPQGSYLIRWTALSNADGHTTSGAIGFNLGHSSTGLPGEVILGPSTSNYLPELNMQGAIGIAWEWLVSLTLTLWIGILVMESFVLTGPEQSAILTQARKQALPLQWLCLAALLIGEIINLILRSSVLTQAAGNNGIDLSTLPQVLFETNYGHLWLLRIALILAALGLLRWTTRSQSGTGNTTSLRERRSRKRFSQLRQQVTQEQEQDRPKQVPEKEEIEQGDAEESSASKTASSPERTSEAGTMAEARAEPSQEGQARATTSRALAPGLTPALSPRPRSRSASQSKYTLVWLLLAGLILLTIAPSEDVAQLIQLHISIIVLNWLFLAAQCIWLGGAAYLGYVLLPLLPVTEPDRHAETLATLLRPYTPLTLGALGVLLVSGLFLSEASISNIQQLLTDPYGRALFVKILLLALMLILGGYALFFLRPKLTQQAILLPVVNAELPARRTRQSAVEGTENSLKRTMKMQTWLGAGVLLCAVLMSFFAPPIVFPPLNYAASTTSQSAASAQNIQKKQIGDLSVTLQVLPGRVNYANTVVMTILDNRGNPVTNAQVQLSTNMEVMDMGIARVTIKGGDSTYTARFDKDVAFSMPGLWDIVVRISRPNSAPIQGTFQVMLAE